MNDNEFILFRHISNGAVRAYPKHYDDHPVFGFDLEPYDPDNVEYEELKVVVEDHALPVDQRGNIISVPVDDEEKSEVTLLGDWDEDEDDEEKE